VGTVAENPELNLDEGDLLKGEFEVLELAVGGPRIGRLLEAIEELDGVI
jgi:hypothetical protein